MNKLISFDLDGTLITENTWAVLNTALGLTSEDDQRLFTAYLSGDTNYKEWIASIVEIYKTRKNDVSKEELEQLADTLHLRDGAFDTIKKIKELGYKVIIISGAVDIFAEKIAKKLDIDTYLACSKAVFNQDGILTDIENIGDERDAKMKLLREYCQANDYSIDSVISVGDGGNDLEIFKNTKGIVLGEHTDLNEIAWKKISELSEIPGLLN